MKTLKQKLEAYFSHFGETQIKLLICSGKIEILKELLDELE